jgi:hypothetical protein
MQMQYDTPTTGLVRHLRSVGLRPNQRLVEQILARGQEAMAPLLELALDTAALSGSEPTSLGPLHALRLLGELRPIEAAEPLLRQVVLPDDMRPTQAVVLWEEEVPQVVARFGPEVFSIALRIADDETASASVRGAAFETLAFLAATAPSLRDQIIGELRTRLKQAHDPAIKGYVVSALAEVGARETYTEVMDAYRTGSVDREIISAASARQMLLGGPAGRRINCATHTLMERYEHHGPYTEEEQQAMAEMVRRHLGQ